MDDLDKFKILSEVFKNIGILVISIAKRKENIEYVCSNRCLCG